MERVLPFRKRIQREATRTVGVTFLPDALARLEHRCDVTQLSRGAVLSDLIMTGLPPAPLAPAPGQGGAA